MNFIVRQAVATDTQAIYDLIYTAFLTAEHRDGDEQDFAVKLRAGANYIPELELVAESDGKLIGHILFTKTWIECPDGNRFNTLMVAPLSVLIDLRNMGVGSTLMYNGLRIAEKMGYTTAFLCGDPNFYQRLGYEPSHRYAIRHEAIPDEYVLVHQMSAGALDGVSGIIKLG